MAPRGTGCGDWRRGAPGTASPVTDDGADERGGDGESATTIAFALAANLAIAIAKLVGGLLSGSVAMLAEAGHSLADSVNQVFLGVSLSLGRKPPDEDHPFGYGKERFFWAFLAAAFIFVAGAVFSIVEGVRAFLGGGGAESFGVAYAVLGVAALAEGTSLVRALRQSRAEALALGRGVREHLRLSKDPTVKVVVLEDGAAVVGLLLAAAGIGLHQLTGDHRWDAVASIAVGVLLAFVAYQLGHDTKELLLGEAAIPAEREAIRAAIDERPEVDEIVEVLTMAVGPHALLVAVRAVLRDGLRTDEIQQVCGRIEADVREAVPDVVQFFIDPTGRDDRTAPTTST